MSTVTMVTTVRNKGLIWRVFRQPQETEEEAKDRAWYVSNNLPADMPIEEREALSRQWANEKFYTMKYQENNVTHDTI